METQLPEKRSEQIFQTVIQPLLLKPVKVSNYSTIFQIFHQTGAFNGIDTFSAINFRNFDLKSILSSEAKAISITNCSHINAYLIKIRQDKIIS